jgi:hypothetical protein
VISTRETLREKVSGKSFSAIKDEEYKGSLVYQLKFFSCAKWQLLKPAHSTWILSRAFLFPPPPSLPTTRVEEEVIPPTASFSTTKVLLKRPQTKRVEGAVTQLTASSLEQLGFIRGGTSALYCRDTLISLNLANLSIQITIDHIHFDVAIPHQRPRKGLHQSWCISIFSWAFFITFLQFLYVIFCCGTTILILRKQVVITKENTIFLALKPSESNLCQYIFQTTKWTSHGQSTQWIMNPNRPEHNHSLPPVRQIGSIWKLVSECSASCWSSQYFSVLDLCT